MNRLGVSVILAVACFGTALAQKRVNLAEDAISRRNASPAVAAKAPTLNWNPHNTVLFKGTIRGIHESAPLQDGKSWVSLLVKLSNGGTAYVELGPKDYVDAQSMRLRTKAKIWVAGSKVFAPNGDSVILAQRVNFDEMRPSFRRPNGKPFWER